MLERLPKRICRVDYTPYPFFFAELIHPIMKMLFFFERRNHEDCEC
nr:MAG TPA: hypothetical protein [Caudoviricetes sp.]